MGSPDSSSVVPGLTIDLALRTRDTTFIDLRSPGEFTEDHLPGAANIPLFDDAQRSLIGTLYHRQSREEAFREGWEQTRGRIESLLQSVARIAGWDLPHTDAVKLVDRFCSRGMDSLEAELSLAPVETTPDRPVVFYCWRGGLRSRSVVALLRRLGFPRALCLQDGYRGYRRLVMQQLDRASWPPMVVLRGLTGVGKTLLLRRLEDRYPGLTVDLEGLAGHRSSILGMVGLEPCSQKAFDSRLAQRLQRGFPHKICVVEGESRKVGDTILPGSLWKALSNGRSVELHASLERRIRVLSDDYLEHAENRTALARQLTFIEERLGSKKFGGVFVNLLTEKREDELVTQLLEHYYDPLYRHSEKRYSYVQSICTDRPSDAVVAIADFLFAGSAS